MEPASSESSRVNLCETRPDLLGKDLPTSTDVSSIINNHSTITQS